MEERLLARVSVVGVLAVAGAASADVGQPQAFQSQVAAKKLSESESDSIWQRLRTTQDVRRICSGEGFNAYAHMGAMSDRD